MRTKTRSKLLFVVVLAVIAIAAVVIIAVVNKPKPVDPHEGQVYIDDGFGMVWMTPLEGVDVNPIAQSDIRTVNGRPEYVGTAFETRRGLDVSEHQLEIDWQQVAQSGVKFAYIRLGYRGYTEGGLFDDAYFKQNIEGALANGLDVGVYFFSQAISTAEALEEARYVIDRLAGYKVTLPVMFDWEKIEGGGARTDNLPSDTLNNCAVAFCEAVKNAGYTPGVYFNRYLGYYGFDLSKLTDYEFWLAVPGEFPDFYYRTDIWQYSFTDTVPGISTPTDMNMMFIPIETQPPEGGEAANNT